MAERLDGLALAGRMLIVPLFLFSGWAKLVSPAATLAHIQSAGLPQPQLAYLIAIAAELGGSSLLLAGFHTRKVAAAMMLFTIAAALSFHAGSSALSEHIQLLKDMAIAGGLLQILVMGGGRYSLDHWLMKA